MKTTTLIFMLMSLIGYAQTDRIPPPIIALQVTQDGKLAFTEDDYGNKPWTWDLYAKVMINGYRSENTGISIYVAPKYQYANLEGGRLDRYAAELGVDAPLLWFNDGTFSQRRGVGFTAGANYGRLKRENKGTTESWEASLELWCEPFKGVGVVVGNYLTERSDIGEWRYNLTAGLRLYL